MPATLTSTLSFALRAALANSVGLASVAGPVEKTLNVPLASGTGANQCDKMFSESAKSISGNYDVDLAGVLLDIFGAAITFARVKVLVITTDAGNAGNLIIGNGGVNSFLGPFGAAAHTINVRPGGACVLFAPDATGYAVTAATGDILRFAPSAGTVVFDWAVLGASI